MVSTSSKKVLIFVSVLLSTLQEGKSTCRLFYVQKDGNTSFTTERNPNKPSEVLECAYQHDSTHLHVTVGNPVVDLDKCNECRCYKSGYMTCCGIGWKSTTMMVPKGCKIKPGENCTFNFVDALDFSTPCGEVPSTSDEQKTDKNGARETVGSAPWSLVFLILVGTVCNFAIGR